jgi:hypothetical protein
VAKNSQEKAAWITPVTTAPKGFLRRCTGTAAKIASTWRICARQKSKTIVSKKEIKATLCMTQRTCGNLADADYRMMQTYGKTSLLSKKNKRCDF